MGTEPQQGAMPYDERDDGGEFARKYTDEMVLGVLEEQNGAGTGDVADALGCSPRLALLRLRELEEEGRVTARPVGNTYLWRRAEDV